MKNNKTNSFWDCYSSKNLSNHSLMNLEKDKNLAKIKLNLEIKHLEKVLNFKDTDVVLDLGAGIGLWSKYFATKVAKVVLVEKQANFVEKARKYLAEYNNVVFYHSDILSFDSNIKFDKIMLSGVSIYLSDKNFNLINNNVYNWLKDDGILIHRDAYGIDDDFLIDKYSEELDLDYKAFYRSLANYKSAFERANLIESYCQDMYEKESSFNKRLETRLRLAIYSKR